MIYDVMDVSYILVIILWRFEYKTVYASSTVSYCISLLLFQSGKFLQKRQEYLYVDPKEDPNVTAIDRYIQASSDEQSEVSVAEQDVVELCPPKPHWNAKYFGENLQDPTDCAYMDDKRLNLLTP